MLVALKLSTVDDFVTFVEVLVTVVSLSAVENLLDLESIVVILLLFVLEMLEESVPIVLASATVEPIVATAIEGVTEMDVEFLVQEAGIKSKI